VNIEVQADGPLSEAEFRAFTGLLRRFCQHELDQWENWRYRTSQGYVYMTISRELPDGHPAEAYDEIRQADPGS
jgi:hypothetical protein